MYHPIELYRNFGYWNDICDSPPPSNVLLVGAIAIFFDFVCVIVAWGELTSCGYDFIYEGAPKLTTVSLCRSICVCAVYWRIDCFLSGLMHINWAFIPLLSPGGHDFYRGLAISTLSRSALFGMPEYINFLALDYFAYSDAGDCLEYCIAFFFLLLKYTRFGRGILRRRGEEAARFPGSIRTVRIFPLWLPGFFSPGGVMMSDAWLAGTQNC
jgi:hypothetical protein